MAREILRAPEGTRAQNAESVRAAVREACDLLLDDGRAIATAVIT